MRRPFPSPYQPERNASCLCGSGLKFKQCCLPGIPRKVLWSQAQAAMAAGKFDDAIIECRADITQHTIWHKSHTEPFLAVAPQPARAILDTDIRALSALVDVLMQCYGRTDSAAFLGVLERLRSNIHDP